MHTLKTKHFHLIDDTDIASTALAAINRVEVLATSSANTIRTWSHRASERRKLASMSEHMLNDIGSSRVEATLEANKYFWEK